MDSSAPPPSDEIRSEALRLARVRSLTGLSYLSAPQADPASVADFFKAAAEFWELAPWEVLASEEVLEVDGLGPERMVLSVRGGEEGEDPGMAVFLSREEAETLGRCKALLVFETPETVGPSLLAEIRDHGFRLAQPDAIPVAALREHGGLAGAHGLASLARCMRVVKRFLAAGLDEKDSVDQVPLSLGDRSKVRITWREVDPFAGMGHPSSRGQASAAPEKEARTQEDGPAREPFRHGPRPGRNDPCWCGSGQKYKKCHLDADRQEDSTRLSPEA